METVFPILCSGRDGDRCDHVVLGVAPRDVDGDAVGLGRVRPIDQGGGQLGSARESELLGGIDEDVVDFYLELCPSVESGLIELQRDSIADFDVLGSGPTAEDEKTLVQGNHVLSFFELESKLYFCSKMWSKTEVLCSTETEISVEHIHCSTDG